MLPVYICEDNISYLNKLKTSIENTILIEELDMEVVFAAPSPHELLLYLSEHPMPSVYFLDVDLKSDIDGFQLAEKIRKYDPRGFLVFVTTHDELSHMTFQYKVEAMDYISKEDSLNLDGRIKACLFRSNELFTSPANKVHKSISLKMGGRFITIHQEDIIGIETSLNNPHFIVLAGRASTTELTYTLSSLKKLLDECFFQCHKSCIINLEHIVSIDKRNRLVYMNGDKAYPVSIRQMTPLTKRYHEYLLKNGLED